jgi:peptidyl-prolyl cis-trans isomerase-like protein 2
LAFPSSSDQEVRNQYALPSYLPPSLLPELIPEPSSLSTDPVTGRPLTTSSLIKLNFFRNASSENVYSDPVTFKPFTPHSHIVFIATTGNVFAYESIERLCIKAKSWRDLVSDEKFKRDDIVTLQVSHCLESLLYC